MASFHKLPSGLWRAQVARNGVRKSATRNTKAAAQDWAAGIEAELVSVRRGEIPRKTVRQALERYAQEVSPGKKGAHWELLRLTAYGRELWADKWLADLSPSDIAAWRDRRRLVVTAGSVQRDFNLLKAVFSLARKEWRWLKDDPMEGIASPGNNRARTRRVHWREVKAICRDLGYPGDTMSSEVGLAFLIALRTGMRAGEIMSLTPADVNLVDQVARLKDTKNGDRRDVPMTKAAARLFKGWTGWTISARSLDKTFRRARDRCGIVDLHFHDARREALTRLARRVDAMTLAKISGHRDLSLLLNVYYSPTTGEIAKMLDR